MSFCRRYGEVYFSIGYFHVFCSIFEGNPSKRTRKLRIDMERTVPFTKSFEDDLIEVERLTAAGRLRGTLARYDALDRVRFLHSFAIYRWHRAILRWWKNPPREPVVFGVLGSDEL